MRAIIVIVLVGLAGGIAVQSIRLRRMDAKNNGLTRQVAELEAAVAVRSVGMVREPNRTPDDQMELLRLRNQAAQLQAATNELQQLRTQMSQLRPSSTAGTATPGMAGGGTIARESWHFAGYATPEAALESVLFAMREGDHKAFLESVSDQALREFEGKTPEEVSAKLRRDAEKVASFRILERDDLSADEAILVVYVGGERKQLLPMRMQKLGEQWKFTGLSTDRR